MDDDAAVRTDNLSSTNAAATDSAWTTVGSPTAAPSVTQQESQPASIHTPSPRATLDFDENSIAVDSGAADDFGSVDPTSNTLDDARGGMTLISATGDLRTSVATDDFDVPLPSEGRNHHAFRQGDVQQPPLSVGKACDEGCDEVSFKRTHCSFLKDDIELF